MNSIYCSLAIAVAVAAGWILLGWWGGATFGVILGIVAFLATMVVISRRFARTIQPVLAQVQRQAEAGNPLLALNSLETLMPLTRWIPLLEGQLYGQMGVLSLGAGKDAQAIEYLEKATNRSAEAKLFLAAHYYRKNKWSEARRVLEATLKYNRKHVLLHNVFAHLLNKQGETDEAIKVLNAVLAKVPENENTQGNLNRLQNGRKTSMKGFGMHWYSLRLEPPPASMMQQANDPRRGFRQKSRRK